MRLSKEESKSLYLVKAIGIISVVLGHYTDFLSVAKPYYFHMPLFFFIGGITLHDQLNIRKLFKSVSSSMIYLVARYSIIGCVAIFLSWVGLTRILNPFGDSILDSISKAYLGNMHNNQLFLVAWFLLAYTVALTFCTIFVSLFSRYISGEKLKITSLVIFAFLIGFLAISFVSVEYHSSHRQIYNLLTQSMYGSMFMIAGYALKGFVFRVYSLGLFLVLFMATTVITSVYNTTPMVMSWSDYKDGFFLSTIVASLLITCVLITSNAFSSFLRDSSVLISIGKSTRSIMTWHLTIFMLVDMAYSLYLQTRPISTFSVFDHFHNESSIAVYTLCGILIPTYLSKIKLSAKLKLAYPHSAVNG